MEHSRSVRQAGLLQAMGDVGAMRLVLFGFGVLSLLLAPDPGTPASIDGWGLVSTVLAPVLAPLILMVLLLDTMMSALFMSDKEGDARARYKTILLIDLIVAAVVFLYWLPYFVALVK